MPILIILNIAYSYRIFSEAVARHTLKPTNENASPSTTNSAMKPLTPANGIVGNNLHIVYTPRFD